MKTKKKLFFLLVTLTFMSHAQIWQWAKSGDGTGGYEGYGVCTDGNGNSFVTGMFGSPAIVFGSYTLTNSGGGTNVYLTKYDANGNVLWAKSSVGLNLDYGLSVSTDATGNAYLTGYFQSPTIIFGSYTLTNSGGQRMFLVKYDVNGNVLWAKNSIGSGSEYGFSISTDANGNSYITGNFMSPTATFGSYTLTNSGVKSVFVVKYDSNGNVLWAKGSTSSAQDYAYSVSTDINGNAYVTGYFTSSAIIFGSYTLTNAGGGSVFLTKYDANGNVLWAKNSIGSGYDYGYSVSADVNGNAYITGNFTSSTTVFGSYTVTNTGTIFLVKYDPNGTVLWAKNLKGGGGGNSICTDANNIYMCGGMSDTLIVGTYTIGVPLTSPDPMFVARFDQNGNANYAYALTSGADDLNAICVDKHCNAYIGGDFMGFGNPPSLIIGTNTLISTGSENVFMAKISFTANCQSAEGIPQNAYLNTQILLYPNPNSGSFKIQMDNEIENGELLLINSLGQTVHKQKIMRGENNIVAEKVSSGLYHYCILQNKQQVGNGKLIVE